MKLVFTFLGEREHLHSVGVFVNCFICHNMGRFCIQIRLIEQLEGFVKDKILGLICFHCMELIETDVQETHINITVKLPY